jgi:hypothetical protein
MPKSSVEGFRQFARDLCPAAREWNVLGWGKLSPSAELMVYPGSARRVRSGTLELPPGLDRYHWTVTVFGDPDPVAAGCWGELGEARSRTEGAPHAY